MVIYCKSVHFRGFSSPGTPGQAFYEMVSFSENRVLRLLQESGESQPCCLLSDRLGWPGPGPAPTALDGQHSLLLPGGLVGRGSRSRGGRHV